METFVNEGFNKAISDYLASKNKPDGVVHNSILVVFIRLLINIYGELDIINPYQINDENALNNNLMKYGADLSNINKLKTLINEFYQLDIKNKNSKIKVENNYFIDVQKCLIDLFTLKRVTYGVTETQQKIFFDLLYTPGASSALRISDNFKYASNVYEVAEYYKDKLSIKSKENNVEKQLLGFDIYKQFNVSVADLSQMDASQIESLNKQIYNSFDIDTNAMNKEYLLQEKMKQIYRQNHPITTGNGYVDILLIMSVIATTIMVIAVVGMLVF